MEKAQGRTQITSGPKETYPDLFLLVAENYRISDRFCGYSDSLSADNNPMVLVELERIMLLIWNFHICSGEGK